MKIQDIKVFNFSKNGESYIIASSSSKQAKKHLEDKYDVYIANCFEIPESEWDKKNIVMFVDNDDSNEKFHLSIRELLPSEGTQLISTTETEMFGYSI